MTPRCATPGCQERDDLVYLAPTESWVCSACRAEIALIEQDIQRQAMERDDRIASQRIES